MKLTVILSLFLWDNVALTLTHEECSRLPSVKHAFVSDEYRKAEYLKGDVIYFSCDPGYTASFNDSYICTEQGWSGATYGQCIKIGTVPLRLGCARPPALEHGYVLDNSTYFHLDGHKRKYQCDHPFTLTGGPFKTCTNGQWTGDLQCLNISCPKPPLDNFQVVGDKSEYKKEEVLRYTCISGYKKVDGRPSLCRKVGQSAQWTPMPRCEEITCTLPQNPPVGTTYSPLNLNVFKIGQRVEVSCDQNRWVKSKELQSAELVCQGTGRWDFDSACKLVTCSKQAENVYSWDRTRYNSVNMGQTLRYWCDRGYEEISDRATCTRQGWSPNPLCKDRRCTKPPFRNAEVTGHYVKDKYDHNERVHFQCTYDPAVTFYADCRFGEWRGRVPTCREKPCTRQPHIEHGEMLDTQKSEYEHGESVQFKCKGESDNFNVMCQSGEWKEQKSCEGAGG